MRFHPHTNSRSLKLELLGNSFQGGDSEKTPSIFRKQHFILCVHTGNWGFWHVPFFLTSSMCEVVQLTLESSGK